MDIEILSAKIVINLLDTQTGEVMTREANFGEFKESPKRSVARATKKINDTDPVAKLVVLDNKIQFNNAAVKKTGFVPEQKLDIQYEKKGKAIIPVLLLDYAKGNRLSKTYTLSCRGQKREQILKYGTTFELEPYGDNQFKLIGNIEQPEDDIIEIPEEPTDESLDSPSVDIDIENIDFSFD